MARDVTAHSGARRKRRRFVALRLLESRLAWRLGAAGAIIIYQPPLVFRSGAARLGPIRSEQ